MEWRTWNVFVTPFDYEDIVSFFLNCVGNVMGKGVLNTLDFILTDAS